MKWVDFLHPRSLDKCNLKIASFNLLRGPRVASPEFLGMASWLCMQIMLFRKRTVESVRELMRLIMFLKQESGPYVCLKQDPEDMMNIRSTNPLRGDLSSLGFRYCGFWCVAKRDGPDVTH